MGWETDENLSMDWVILVEFEDGAVRYERVMEK